MIGRLSIPRMVGAYILLLLYYTFFLVPILWIILASFKTNSAIIIGNIIPSPSDLTFSSYSEVWNTPGVPTFPRKIAPSLEK